jgi:hypothetical protein
MYEHHHKYGNQDTACATSLHRYGQNTIWEKIVALVCEPAGPDATE